MKKMSGILCLSMLSVSVAVHKQFFPTLLRSYKSHAHLFNSFLQATVKIELRYGEYSAILSKPLDESISSPKWPAFPLAVSSLSEGLLR